MCRSFPLILAMVLGAALIASTGCKDSGRKGSPAPEGCGPSVQSPDDPALEGFLEVGGQSYRMIDVPGEYGLRVNIDGKTYYQAKFQAVDPAPYGYLWFYIYWTPSPLLTDGLTVTNEPGEPIEIMAAYQYDPWASNYWLTTYNYWPNSPFCISFARYGEPGERLVAAFEGKLERVLAIGPPWPHPTDPTDQVEVRGIVVIP